MKTEILAACDDLVSAALNGLGQGVLLVLFVGLCLRLLGPTNAATRHAVWLGTLLLLAGMIPAQFWRERLVLSPPEQMTDSAAQLLPPSSLGPPLPDLDDPPAPAEGRIEGQRQDDSPSVPATERQAGQPMQASPLLPGQSNNPFTWAAQWILPAHSWHFDIRSVVPAGVSVVLVVLWITVLGGRLTLLLWRLHRLRQIKRSSLPASPELEQLFQKVHAQLAVTRPVRIGVSSVHRSAVVLGFIHPVILFPAEAAQAPDGEATEHVLRHELGHVLRFDDWANLLQQCVQAVLFFHPAVWWVSKRLSLEREIASDDFVLQQGGRPQTYALLLVNLAGRSKGSQPALAPGVSTGKYQLQQRITMILNAHRNTSPRLARAKFGSITAATILAGLLVVYAGPKLVLAQSPTPAAAADRLEAASPSVPVVSPHPEALPNPVPQPSIQFSFAEAAAPAIAGSGEAETGPKYKSAENLNEDMAPPASPRPPRKPRAPVAAKPAVPPVPPSAERGSSIEERLDRLEQMVKSLLDQRNPNHVRMEIHEFGDPGRSPFPPDVNQLRADAKRDALAAEKRAAKQVEKAAKLEEMWRDKGVGQEGFQKQLQAFHQQRETLQREMEKLQRQIERLEREHERMVDEKRRHGDEHGDEPKDVAPGRK